MWIERGDAQVSVKKNPGSIVNYRVVRKSEAGAYFRLYLLNALTKYNNFGTLKQQFMTNTVLNDIYLHSLEGATKMKQLALCVMWYASVNT